MNSLFRTLRRLRVPAIALGCCLAAPAWAVTILVSTTADDLAANGNCTLREAIEAAQTDLAVDACPAGSMVDPDVVEIPGDHTLDLGEVVVAAGGGGGGPR